MIPSWLKEKLLSPLGSFDVDITVAPKIVAEIKHFITDVGGLITDEIKEQFDIIANYLKSVASNPADFEKLTIAALLKEEKALLHLVLGLVKTVVIEAVRIAILILDIIHDDVLDKPIKGFFIEEIYNLINPGEHEEPTLLRLTALFCAFHATIIFRVLLGHAPYTEEDARNIQDSTLHPCKYFRDYGLSATNPFKDSDICIHGLIAGILTIMPWTPIEFLLDTLEDETEQDEEGLSGGKIFINLFLSIIFPVALLAIAHPNLDPKANSPDRLNNTNWSKSIEASTIAYFPKDEPPPPWSKSQQWDYYTGRALPFKAPHGDYYVGAYNTIRIADRSNNAVEQNKQYCFYTTVESYSIQLYFELSGVDGGSVCLPGFGLYNLLKHPKAWTYITPEVFEGQWGINLISPGYVTLYLSVEYVPYQGTAPDIITNSGLIFSFQGAGYSSLDLSQKPEQLPSEQQILSREANYVIKNVVEVS